MAELVALRAFPSTPYFHVSPPPPKWTKTIRLKMSELWKVVKCWRNEASTESGMSWLKKLRKALHHVFTFVPILFSGGQWMYQRQQPAFPVWDPGLWSPEGAEQNLLSKNWICLYSPVWRLPEGLKQEDWICFSQVGSLSG